MSLSASPPSTAAMTCAHVCSRMLDVCATSGQLCIKGAKGAKGALKGSVKSLNCSDDVARLSA